MWGLEWAASRLLELQILTTKRIVRAQKFLENVYIRAALQTQCRGVHTHTIIHAKITNLGPDSFAMESKWEHHLQKRIRTCNGVSIAPKKNQVVQRSPHCNEKESGRVMESPFDRFQMELKWS